MRTDNIKEYINQLNNEFAQLQGGTYCKVDTGEIFTQTEVNKYMQLQIESFSRQFLMEVKEEARESDIEIQQRIVNDRSVNPKKKKSKNKTKISYANGEEFNITFRKGIEQFMGIKLDVNSKLTFYVLKDLISYPTNCVIINDKIPAIKDLEPIIGLSERKIRDCLKVLESNNMIKLVQSGHRKAIYVNPQYTASGRELDMETLKMFDLLDCDDDKINGYL